ncbi:hypothetical protein NUACC26_053930 [Scytonema sp. NUACC26]
MVVQNIEAIQKRLPKFLVVISPRIRDLKRNALAEL